MFKNNVFVIDKGGQLQSCYYRYLSGFLNFYEKDIFLIINWEAIDVEELIMTTLSIIKKINLPLFPKKIYTTHPLNKIWVFKRFIGRLYIY
jgi:hypothetical protein